jgi:hypothetical protein
MQEPVAWGEYCPAWHAVQPEDPDRANSPLLQAMQVLAPPAEYRPGPQSVHESAAGAECWPARHVEQSSAPAREYVPPPQLVHWLSEVAPVDA